MLPFGAVEKYDNKIGYRRVVLVENFVKYIKIYIFLA